MAKKFISIAITLLLLLSALPFSASAAADYNTLYARVVESLEKGELEIDVSDLDPSEAQLGILSQEIFDNEPQFFYIKGGMGFSYTGPESNKNIISLRFKYEITDQTERENAIAFVNEQLDAIVATLPKGLDDYEKALYFHDYLCLKFEYDLTYSIYDIYNMFKDGKGVCQAYTGIYDLLLERVGIKNLTAYTDNHIWNIVYLDGKWYHIDVTWGDPVADVPGRACHDDFLRSASVIESTHGSFSAPYLANDTSYDGFGWHNSRKQFGFANGITYMIDEFNIQSVDLLTGKTSVIHTISDKWKVADGTYYSAFSGFGSYNDKLIFNTPKQIMYIDPATGEMDVAANIDIGDNFIFDIYVLGDTVYYTYGADYDVVTAASAKLAFSGSTDITPDPDPDPEVPGVEGDINGDGSFDMFDYMTVKLIYFKTYTPTDAEFARADMNNDNIIDVFDYMTVKTLYFSK